MPVELWVAQELPYKKSRGKTKEKAICVRPLDTYPYHDSNQSISVFIYITSWIRYISLEKGI